MRKAPWESLAETARRPRQGGIVAKFKIPDGGLRIEGLSWSEGKVITVTDDHLIKAIVSRGIQPLDGEVRVPPSRPDTFRAQGMSKPDAEAAAAYENALRGPKQDHEEARAAAEAARLAYQKSQERKADEKAEQESAQQERARAEAAKLAAEKAHKAVSNGHDGNAAGGQAEAGHPGDGRKPRQRNPGRPRRG